jgi:hypothetical protein
LARLDGVGELARYWLQNLRFDRQHQDIYFAGKLAPAVLGLQAEVRREKLPSFWRWLGDPDGAGRLAAGDQPADEARGHVAAADESDGVLHSCRACRGGCIPRYAIR